MTPEEWLKERKGKRVKRPNGRVVYEVLDLHWLHFGWRDFPRVVVQKVGANVPPQEISITDARRMEVVK